MTSAIAVGADLALFPESGKTESDIVDQIVDTVVAVRKRSSRRARRVIVIKAEGVAVPVDRLKTLVDARLQALAPVSEPSSIETRVTVLGHVVRGGRPSAFDRLIGSRLANVAVRVACRRTETLKMASWMPPVELPDEIATRSPYDPYCWLVDLARGARRDRKSREGPQLAGPLARRAHSTRSKTRYCYSPRVCWTRGCSCSSIVRRSACTDRLRTARSRTSTRRSRACSATRVDELMMLQPDARHHRRFRRSAPSA